MGKETRERKGIVNPEHAKSEVLTPPTFRGKLGTIISMLRAGRDLFSLMEEAYQEHAAKGDGWIHLFANVYMPIHPLALREAMTSKSFDKGPGYQNLNPLPSTLALDNGITSPTNENWEKINHIERGRLEKAQLGKHYIDWNVALDEAIAQIDNLQENKTTYDQGIKVYDVLLESLTYKYITKVLSSTAHLEDWQQKAVKEGLEKAFQWVKGKQVLKGLANDFTMGLLVKMSENDYQQSIDEVHAVITGLLEEYIQTEMNADDLLAQLLMAEGEEGGLAMGQTEAEATVMFVAGHETTASAINTIMDIIGLDEYSDVQEKIYQEVTRICGDRPPTQEDIDKMGYLKAVVYEALRLQPPNWLFNRNKIADGATEEIVDPKTGDVLVAAYDIPSGSVIFIPQYFAHRNEAQFPDANKFIPERFLRDNGQGSFAIDKDGNVIAIPAERVEGFHPFGLGVRRCVGNAMGLETTMLTIARLVQKYNLVSTSQRDEISRSVGLAMHLDNVRTRFEKRALAA